MKKGKEPNGAQCGAAQATRWELHWQTSERKDQGMQHAAAILLQGSQGQEDPRGRLASSSTQSMSSRFRDLPTLS